LITPSFPYPDHLINGLWGGLHDAFSHMREQAAVKLEEVVGLILDKGTVRLTNQAHSSLRFSFGPTQLDEVLNRLPRTRNVYAFYHSHPAGGLDLSLEDLTSMTDSFRRGAVMPWLIITDFPSPSARLHWLDPLYLAPASYDLPEERISWQT
jgi:proteasome lid subunit RPN8/RPN11